MNVTLGQLNTLLERCKQESIKYRAGFSNDSRYCLNLWRHALYDKIADAWMMIVDCYTDDLRRWLYKHPLVDIALTREVEQYFFNETFIRVWLANERDPIDIETLPTITSYIKRALHRLVLEVCRRKPPVPLTSDQPGSDMEDEVFGNLGAKAIWDCVLECTRHDPSGRRLAYLLWLCEWRPRHVVAAYPQEYSTARHVDWKRTSIKDCVQARCPQLVPAKIRRG
jgi:hypothetical protein